jgi:glutaconate CoA-transferase subunit B
MPGSGGANDLASFCWRTLVLTVQDKRRFVEKVDFMTTPGWLKGGTSREDYGLPRGTGPYRVITNMGLMDYEPVSKRMRIFATNPGYTVKDIQDNCGFELLIADEIQKTPPPTKEELHLLRTEVDVHRYIIGRNAE